MLLLIDTQATEPLGIALSVGQLPPHIAAMQDGLLLAVQGVPGCDIQHRPPNQHYIPNQG